MLCKGVVIEMGRQNDTLETIFKLRRSCRAYNPEMKIPREDLETIVRAGRYAPSGLNRQPWHFTVLTDLSSLGGERDRLRGATALIFVSGSETLSYLAKEDCILATENMYLAAASLGIASCWTNYFVRDYFVTSAGKNMRKRLIPDGYTVYSASVFGYPADPDFFSSRRLDKRSECVSFVEKTYQ